MATALLLLATMAATSSARGDESTPAARVSAAGNPSPQLLSDFCHGCHSGKAPKGEFRIDDLAADVTAPQDRERWLSIAERLRSGTMPPKGKPAPERAEAKALSDWIVRQVELAQRERNPRQGRAVMRRMNRIEYQNTIRDLLQVEVDLQGVIPDDTTAGGFDTDSASLQFSSYQLDGYLTAANRVLDAAIASGPRPRHVQRRVDLRNESITQRRDVYRHVDDGVAIFASDLASNIQVVFWNFLTRARGKYRYRISAYAYQTDEPILFHINSGTNNLGEPPQLIEYFEAPPGKPTVIEFVEQFEAGRNIRLLVDTEMRPRDLTRQGGAADYRGPGLVVQWVEMEGPLEEAWPPPSHRLLFSDLPQAPRDGSDQREVRSEQPLADAETILRRFARRAFRRTVTDDDLKPFLKRVQKQLEHGQSFERAVRVGLQGVLVSPEFLFLRERIGAANHGARELPPLETTPAVDPEAPGGALDSAKLDEFGLASRLSYFLWSSMPDEQLLQLAEQGRLGSPETLREQVERMLRDPKASAFTENFAGQWLGLREIDATLPDRQLYPDYDDILRSSMLKEPGRFFDEVLTHDLSLTNFVDSNFSFLNERLARHYGIEGVEGLAMRKVELPPDSHRGGVMTMAAVLKVTANGTTTSPVVRGAWVLDRMLGTPPPSPPANVAAVDPDIRGATTIREQLAKHRQTESCASCHVTIDPPGFALENFDVIGGWREHYRSIGDGQPVVIDGRRMRYKRGPAVDAGDVLPNGRRFRNVDEYKQLLLGDPDQLTRALAEKLLAYATGTPPGLADQADVERVVQAARKKNYGFRSLVHEVVQSNVFQTK
ncbi:MAG: DUF1592 domain-containing protein [Planctomycetales bacterium]|nr:DUF1592 domain-containing protein [Planctomycetales bacterium]